MGITHSYRTENQVNFNALHYEVEETGLIDYAVIKTAEKNKLIITGRSAYSRIIDFKKFREM